MAILNNNPLVGASGNQGGYNINNSLRFRQSASAYLNRTPSVAGNQQKFTWSGWVKIGYFTTGYLQAADGNSGNRMTSWYMRGLGSTGVFEFEHFDGTTTYNLTTNAVFRDPSAWYHITVAVDTTQATSADRTKIYVNGNQQTVTGTYVPQNTTLYVNGTTIQAIGSRKNVTGGYGAYFDGYMTEVNFIDGQALTASSFGETDTTTGVWKPKAYTGTYGTNGFYLKFSDIATTSGSNAGLGKDFSGNSNYWTTNNISVTSGTTYDAMTDSPTNTSATVGNFATLNPLNAIGTTATFSNANLSLVLPDGSLARTAFATMGVSSGKYYWEMTVGTTAATYYPAIGVNTNTAASPLNQSGADSTGYMYMVNGQKFNNGSLTSYGATYATNDVIGVALDMDAGTITFYKNNASQGQAFSGLSGTAVPCFIGQVNASCSVNFGQRPFAYTPPTGYVALNTYNLPTSTIVKGNTVMDATLYTGTGSSLSVTNTSAFKPDFVWVKGRSGATDHALYDSVRGTTIDLVSNSTAAETTQAQGLTAFGTGGFTVGTLAKMNTNGATYVGWQWQAGQGSTSSNTSGSITSTTSVNTTAGFSVVTYTGTGSNATVGHGLGVAPKMVIVKSRTTAENWMVYHTSIGATKYIYLDSTGVPVTLSTIWNNTEPTSSVFSIGTNVTVNQSSTNYVAYCWAEIAGYSKFGSYTGNGSTDGPFVYLGFRPKFVIFKDYSNAHSWVMVDSSRNTYNVAGDYLRAESSAVENATYSVANNTAVDFLSNGFKLRNAGVNSGENNGSSNYLYMAWAENPFKNSLAR